MVELRRWNKGKSSAGQKKRYSNIDATYYYYYLLPSRAIDRPIAVGNNGYI